MGKSVFNFLKIRKKIQNPENKHALLIGKIRKLKPESARFVFTPYMSLLEIRVSYKTIQEFNQFLLRILRTAEVPENITPGLFQAMPSFMLLKDWFVTQQGLYVKPDEEVQVFKDRTIEIIDIYMDLEATPNVVNDKARSLLSPLVNQISEIVNQLSMITSGEEKKQPGSVSAIKDSGF